MAVKLAFQQPWCLLTATKAVDWTTVLTSHPLLLPLSLGSQRSEVMVSHSVIRSKTTWDLRSWLKGKFGFQGGFVKNSVKRIMFAWGISATQRGEVFLGSVA